MPWSKSADLATEMTMAAVPWSERSGLEVENDHGGCAMVRTPQFKG
ncbi:hypothetical protein ACFO4N_11310 [Camelliibacillus cellulosilyticus]|uniref:Uncharacterized protein n=1 Tax=Camelliibacillus cellulosilyticus TaxID=2174486 RepID=A0ABV9GRK0_9BACL